MNGQGSVLVKVAFFSNYLNNHQLPFCLAMERLTGGNFTFVATTSAPPYRKKVQFEDLNEVCPFVLRADQSEENRQKALQLAMDCDVVISGSAPEEYTRSRIKKGLLTFRYSERLYKKNLREAFKPHALGSRLRHHTRFWNKPVYMLCASAFTARDYGLSGAYWGKTYKWGYFPETRHPDKTDLYARKERNEKPVLLWVGRLIGLKHPEAAVDLAKRLKDDGYDFTLRLVGAGHMEQQLREQITAFGLENQVVLTGALPSDRVRDEMERANIFLFTSNRREGWGAVLNESMNAGCAVVASDAIGAAPFLVKHGENGLIYPSGDENALYEAVKGLLDRPAEQRRLGEAALYTVTELWNAETAAERVLQLSRALAEGKKGDLFTEGPCSRAPWLWENWFKKKINRGKP